MDRSGICALAAAIVLGGCNLKLPGTAVQVSSRLTGQWMNTIIDFQVYRSVEFVDKSGNVLDPLAAETMPPDQVDLRPGDLEDLTYASGKLRYAYFPHETDQQPYVAERPIQQADFEALDKALYDDKFFSFKSTNYSQQRIPLYFIQYTQGDKGFSASFAPSLTVLSRTEAIVQPYLYQLGHLPRVGEDAMPPGADQLPSGVSQYVYYLSASGGQMKLSIATDAPDSSGTSIETDWKVTGANVDTGSGFQPASIATDSSITFPQPQGGGAKLVGLKIDSSGTPSHWETVIPVRGQ